VACSSVESGSINIRFGEQGWRMGILGRRTTSAEGVFVLEKSEQRLERARVEGTIDVS